MTIALNLLIIVAALVLDHPGVLQAPEHQRVVLDIVHTDPVVLHAALEQRLAARVLRTGCTQSRVFRGRLLSPSATAASRSACQTRAPLVIAATHCRRPVSPVSR